MLNTPENVASIMPSIVEVEHVTAAEAAHANESVLVYTALLDTLCERLPQSAKLVEESTGDLSLRFRQLAESSRAQSDKLNELIDLSTHVAVENEKIALSSFLEMFSQLLSNSISQTLYISKMAMEMVYTLDAAISNLQNIEAFIGRVQSINKKARILALNASIEASKAGQTGEAFNIVANEVKQMANTIDGLAADMQHEIQLVSSSVREGYGMLEKVATIDLSDTLKTKDKLEKLMDSLLKQSEQFKIVIEDSAASSRSTAETIGRMVVNMQFQDRNSQYIDNSVNALVCLSDEFKAYGMVYNHKVDALKERLLSGFTLSEFRQPFAGNLIKHNLLDDSHYQAPSPSSSDSDDNVELF